MKIATNIPYVRTGAIEDKAQFPYINLGANRAERRKTDGAFIGNSKSLPLTVVGTSRYLRHVQITNPKMVKGKIVPSHTIHHYLPQ